MGGYTGLIYKILAVFMLCIFNPGSQNAWAQHSTRLTGVVTGPDNKPLPGATIILRTPTSKTALSYSISNAEGKYTIQVNNDTDGGFLLVAEHIGMKSQFDSMVFIRGMTDRVEYHFKMEAAQEYLKEVIIKAPQLPFSVRGDTVDFKAGAYKNAETKKVEDLLSNIPGFDISDDGRISFNGKQLDRILIEGEDLTENNYKLISRNLNANIIDRIQVIHDFSADRLMKEVEKSGNIGINLTIDPKFRNKLTGGLELAAGIGGRESLDNDMIRIGKNLKLMSFLNYNETGSSGREDLTYHFKRDGDFSDGQNEFPENSIIKSGDIAMPNLEKTYVRDNEDISGFSIISCKLGQAAKMKMLAGKARSGIKKKSTGTYNVLPPDTDPWQMIVNESYRASLKDSDFKLAFDHDKGNNNTGSYDLEYIHRKSGSTYTNNTKGVISDSLLERMTATDHIVAFSGTELFRLGEGKVLKADIRFTAATNISDLIARTGRYREYFRSDSSQSVFGQDLDRLDLENRVRLSYHVRRKATDWKSGFLVEGGKSDFRGQTISMDEILRATNPIGKSMSRVNTVRTSIHSTVQKRVSDKIVLTAGLNVGIAGLRVELDNVLQSITEPIYKTMSGIEYSIGHFKKISFSHIMNKGLPERNYFHPSKLISGQVSILDPAKKLRLREDHSIGFSYSSNQISRGRLFFATATYGKSNSAYAYNATIRPEYSYQYILDTDNANIFFSNLRLEKYVPGIRMKLITALAFSRIGNNVVFNEMPARNLSGNISLKQKMITAFAGPINLELSVTGSRLNNKTIQSSGSSNTFHQWQYEAHGKLKMNPGKRSYTALVYNLNSLSPKNFFHSMDLFFDIQTAGSLHFSITARNLFNATSLWKRSFSINSYTENQVALVGRYVLFEVRFDF